MVRSRVYVGDRFTVRLVERVGGSVVWDGGRLVVVTDLSCDEVRRVVFEEVNKEFRDFVFSFSIVATAILLGVVGVFWKTYVVVYDHFVAVGALTYVFGLGVSVLLGLRRRRAFLRGLIVECVECSEEDSLLSSGGDCGTGDGGARV